MLPLLHRRNPSSSLRTVLAHTQTHTNVHRAIHPHRFLTLTPIVHPQQVQCQQGQKQQLRHYARQPQEPRVGTTTPVPDNHHSKSSKAADANLSKSPFYFEAGYALYAKRPSRPFPPPFVSYPSGSFSEPLSTHNRSRDRRPHVDGEMIRGVTNGDDAVVVGENYIGANDGVGAWATKEKGHAALWSRLILHFWALEAEKNASSTSPLDPIAYLQTAYDKTLEATTQPSEWFGTTTACSALLSSTSSTSSTGSNSSNPDNPKPLLYVTQLGDSQVLVLRPKTREVIFRTEEQWHWFDCPRQLGTNSPDTPIKNAILDKVEIEEDDIVLAMTDGVIDNLWEHEVVTTVVDALEKWESGGGSGKEYLAKEGGEEDGMQTYADGMRFVAQELLGAARKIAEDPFAESPYMEKAIDEGLSIEGGKLDDISVVAAQCKRRKG